MSPLRLILFLMITISAALPVAAQDRGYIGTAACTTCHAPEAEAWAASHHAKAWLPATAENILADFDGTQFSLGDMHVAFRVAEDGYYAAVTERDGSTRDYKVHSVAGVTPLQQYLFETEPGRLQSFDVVWDTQQGRWFHLYPEDNPAPAEGMHWTGAYKTWNSRCASCHATDFHANYDVATRSFASTQAEMGVGCEACHGPGAAHRDWATGPRMSTPPLYGLPVDMRQRDQMLDQCAGCHSRREALFDGTPPAGTAYHDAYNLSQLRPGLYFPDGQIRDEVYVYGSFLQSKMFAKGVSCTNCHDPHSGNRLAEGNAVCTQCHSPAGNPDFPSLPLREYDTPDHTHHAAGSAGAACKSCHMPERVYMGNDWRADHSFRIPRPDLNAQTGAGDACTGCHQDQSVDWAAARIAEWFPDSPHRGAHYGTTLADGFDDPAAASADLVRLAMDAEMPGLARATALWLIAQSGDPQAADQVAALLSDPDPVVRAGAADAQRAAAPADATRRLTPLLSDPVRNVRITATRPLLRMLPGGLPQETLGPLRAAFAELQAALMARLDYPETHLQLGGIAMALRNIPAAASAFATATGLDPQLVDAWVMRARIASAVQGPAAARRILDQGLAANPGNVPLSVMRIELGGLPAAPGPGQP